MPKYSRVRIDVFYDITCSACGKSRSTDYSKGMAMYRLRLIDAALREGWTRRGDRTLCPVCNKRKRYVAPPVNVYFDVGCDCCGKHRSTDFGHGMDVSRQHIMKNVYAEGWKCRQGRTICPVCFSSGKYKRRDLNAEQTSPPDFGSCKLVDALSLFDLVGHPNKGG